MKDTKGVCRLSIIPVRACGEETSEMVTQLLFGDHYTILNESEDKKWVKIKIYFDGYEGWIDHKQHTPISDEYFEQINSTDYKISTGLVANILYKKNKINILLGSIVPISSNELFKIEEQLAFNGEAKNLSQRFNFDYLKEVAFKYQNAPYLWGGKTPFGIDCSGFVQQVFKICGYKLKRDASQQALQGIKIEDFEEVRPGDLAFFQNEKGKINHVGILLDNYEIIHSSGMVKVDSLDEVGIFTDMGDYTHKLAFTKRIIK